MKRAVVSFVTGALFAVGLAIAGMTRPEKVLGFLDVAGTWDPSLACVMGGALAVCLLVFARVMQRRAPWLDAKFHLPTQTGIDAKLVLGAALFGAGWGLSGYCPGPAIASLVTGAREPIVFVAAMSVGFALFELGALRARRSSASPGVTAVSATSP